MLLIIPLDFRNFSISFLCISDGLYHDFEVDRQIAPVKEALSYAEKNKLPMIVWWTPFTGDMGKLKRCWSGDCFFTQNRSFYSHPLTQAFLFYGTDFHEDNIPLPRKG